MPWNRYLILAELRRILFIELTRSTVQRELIYDGRRAQLNRRISSLLIDTANCGHRFDKAIDFIYVYIHVLQTTLGEFSSKGKDLQHALPFRRKIKRNDTKITCFRTKLLQVC